MTLEELKKLIADDEGETVEVKETSGRICVIHPNPAAPIMRKGGKGT